MITSNRNSNVKIGFVFDENLWQGGRSYLRNLLAAIRAVPGVDMTPIVITGTRTGDLSREFPETAIVRAPMLDRMTPRSIMRRVLRTLTSQDVVLHRCLRKQDISVLSHSGHMGGGTEVRTIGWIPDFQHVHLPEFFIPAECRQRDRDFMDICARCDRVLVSSEYAYRDLKKFAPQHAHKAAVLQFVASPAPIDGAANLSDLQRIYNFEGPYFLAAQSNFWIHKNHRVVIRALQILNQRGRKFTVLATGAKIDYRHPAYFSSLMEYAKECGVFESFRVLGPVPFDHLVAY